MSTSEEPKLEPDDQGALDSFKDMLSFYGVELQSHASVTLGLAVLIFAIIQAWGQLAAASRLTDYHASLFSGVVGIAGAGIVYQGLRLYVFGKLASALTVGRKNMFEETKKVKGKEWKQYSDLLKVNVYTSHVFQKTARPLVILRVFTPDHRVNAWVLVAAFEVWFVSSYSLVFGTFKGCFLLEFVVGSGLGILGTYYLIVKGLVVGCLREPCPQKIRSQTNLVSSLCGFVFPVYSLAAVGALATLVAHVVFGEEFPATAGTLPPQLNSTTTRQCLKRLRNRLKTNMNILQLATGIKFGHSKGNMSPESLSATV